MVLLLHHRLLQLHQARVVQLGSRLRLSRPLLRRHRAAARQKAVPVALVAALQRLLYLLPPVLQHVQQVSPPKALLLTPVGRGGRERMGCMSARVAFWVVGGALPEPAGKQLITRCPPPATHTTQANSQRRCVWRVEPLEEAVQAGAQGAQLAARGCCQAGGLGPPVGMAAVALLWVVWSVCVCVCVCVCVWQG
jgi:hypothetical protein